MPDLDIAIDKILAGDQQSLFQALRLFSSLIEKKSYAFSLPQSLEFIHSPALTKTLNSTESFINLEIYLSQLQSKAESTTSENLTELLFVDLLLNQLWCSINPHQAIRSQVQKLFWIMGIHFLKRPDLSITIDHPYTQLLQLLIQELCIWEPTAGRLQKKIPLQLEELIKTISHFEIKNRKEIEQLATNFKTIIQQQDERTKILQQRQVQSKLINIDTEAARQSIVSFIDLRLSGKLMPQPIAQFIVTTLLKDLQYLIITQGVESSLLKKWKRLLQVLSWAFLPQDNPQQIHKINTLLMPFMEQLDDTYYREFSSSQSYKHFFDQLLQYFIFSLQQKTIDFISFQSINPQVKNQPLTIVNQNLVTNLEEHKVGDWFWMIDDNGEKLRASLAFKEPKKDLLLFSDYQGKIIRESSFEDFSLELALKSAQPMQQHHIYENSLKITLTILDQRYQERKYRTKIQQEVENQKRSAEKAAHESKKLVSKKDSSTIQKPKDSSQLETYAQQLATLHTGSWLLLTDENTKSKKIRLSVKIQAQDKYIFTDHVGQRVAQYSLYDMAQLMASSQLEILSRVQGFENSLERIVRQIRSKKND